MTYRNRRRVHFPGKIMSTGQRYRQREAHYKSAVILRALPTLLLCIALTVMLSGCIESYFLYHPYKTIISTPKSAGLDFENIFITTADRVRLNAWWVPAERERGTVLFFHGNGGNISYCIDTLLILNRLRLSTFIIDYRGYGLSAGSPSEEGLYRDAEAAWKHLTETRGIPVNRIIVFGRSLGGSVAAWLAHRTNPQLLIVESAFSNLNEMAKDFSKGLPVSAFVRSRYDTAEYVRSTRCPIMVIHSPDDELIPFRHARIIFDAIKGEKYFLSIRGSHNEGFVRSLPLYEEALNRFIGKHMKETY